MAEDKKITLERPQDWIGLTLRIPNEQALTGEILGPLVGELTHNNVVFLKSLNKSSRDLRVGYTVLDGKLHRYESSYGHIPPPPNSNRKKGTWGWSNYEPGCHETHVTISDLVTCKIEVTIYDLSDEKPPRSFDYKPPKREPEAQEQEQEKAPPPPTQTDEGWILI